MDPRFTQVHALVFDLDGTLVDSGQDLVHAANAARAHLGLPPLDDHTVLHFVGRGARELMRRALGGAPTEREVNAALEIFRGYYAAHLLDNTRPYPGVEEALARLKGRRLAVLTNKSLRFTQPILEGLGLARWFARICGEDSYPRKKPDPLGLESLLREFAVSPAEAIMVGDSAIDIQTARNAGTWACGVRYGLASHELQTCAPDLVVSSLLELADAVGA